jgi:iron(II)-dependent oxidoreductase
VIHPLADQLQAFHHQLLEEFSPCSETVLRTQYHPDLSQLGWHLSHIAFVEHYWLNEVIMADDSRTRDSHEMFFPELIEKASRGQLAGITDMQRLADDFKASESMLDELLSKPQRHSLLSDGYIGFFLLQHGQQHRETMHMVLKQKVFQDTSAGDFEAVAMEALEPLQPDAYVTEGEYPIGTDAVGSCDNEQPLHGTSLSACSISTRPVSNAEYLGFIINQGYERKELWTEKGWEWKLRTAVRAPEYWISSSAGNWYTVSPASPVDLCAADAVSGLSWYEADAFARYADNRLPHENEWECAMKTACNSNNSKLWASTGSAWEWCANTFYPYPEFRAFPYQRYSTPWFDGGHFVLRGSSPYSGHTVRTPTFRNFYQPDKRHVNAGLRLAADA